MLSAKNKYAYSLNAPISTIGPDVRGGSLGRTSNITATHDTATTRPMARTVQWKPILGRSCCAMTGKIMPPTAPPVALSEIAMDLFLEKYVDTLAMVGANTTPHPSPWHRPCARNSCQYSDATLVV